MVESLSTKNQGCCANDSAPARGKLCVCPPGQCQCNKGSCCCSTDSQCKGCQEMAQKAGRKGCACGALCLCTSSKGCGKCACSLTIVCKDCTCCTNCKCGDTCQCSEGGKCSECRASCGTGCCECCGTCKCAYIHAMCPLADVHATTVHTQHRSGVRHSTCCATIV